MGDTARDAMAWIVVFAGFACGGGEQVFSHAWKIWGEFVLLTAKLTHRSL